MSRITHMSFSSSLPKRTPKAGDERTTKKHGLQVRQQTQHRGMSVVSNGKPVWDWVDFNGDRDRMKDTPRYRTNRTGQLIEPPHGWRILESGKPIPKTAIYYHQEPNALDAGEWVKCDSTVLRGEAQLRGSLRAIAVPITADELESQNAANKSS